MARRRGCRRGSGPSWSARSASRGRAETVRPLVRHEGVRSIVIVFVALVTACGPGDGALSAVNPSATAATTATPAGSAPSLTPIGGCSDPVKCSTPPPGYTPYAGPACDAPLTTPYEIRLAASVMHAAPGDPQPASLDVYGAPLLVHGLRIGDPDE